MIPNMLTCTKTYTDIPFAHRQHHHDGHCAFIHGHNWSISITFGCHRTDENGFIVDFGKLKFLREWIDKHLDHACVLNEDDPIRDALVTAAPGAWKIHLVKSCSCEGIAAHLYQIFNDMVKARTENRAFVLQVEVKEDAKNAAVYRGREDSPA